MNVPRSGTEPVEPLVSNTNVRMCQLAHVACPFAFSSLLMTRERTHVSAPIRLIIDCSQKWPRKSHSTHSSAFLRLVRTHVLLFRVCCVIHVILLKRYNTCASNYTANLHIVYINVWLNVAIAHFCVGVRFDRYTIRFFSYNVRIVQQVRTPKTELYEPSELTVRVSRSLGLSVLKPYMYV